MQEKKAQEGTAIRFGELTFGGVREDSHALVQGLSEADVCVQSMPDASPAKWHLAHTTWFFETFILKEADPSYKVFDERFNYLFNSYYETVGKRHARPHRGMLSRPSMDNVMEYRAHVNAAMEKVLASKPAQKFLGLTELGLHHEQQHQELLLTDILHMFSMNPVMNPEFRKRQPALVSKAPEMKWVSFNGGVAETGFAGEGFSFDNEGPRHKTYLNPYALASRPVTVREYLAFMNDGGYNKPLLWLADGWATVKKENWDSPLYWENRDGEWWSFTLNGFQPVELDAPVTHVSFYEAQAFAAWAGARLPTEFEWENASAGLPVEGNFATSKAFRPLPAQGSTGLQQMFGDVWEWTSSGYNPYPGFKAAEGAVGEYNGKFMSNQYVLRGGSCATPGGHTRATYRNFFYSHQRWQFNGLRLAKDVS